MAAVMTANLTSIRSLPVRPDVNGPVLLLGHALPSGIRSLHSFDFKTLPRYARQKTLTSGAIGYYWSIPTWAKRQGCPQKPVALGTSRLAAFIAAEAQNHAFDRWRDDKSHKLRYTIPTRQPDKSKRLQKPLRSLAELSQLMPAHHD